MGLGEEGSWIALTKDARSVLEGAKVAVASHA
jgi:hypothetical protein